MQDTSTQKTVLLIGASRGLGFAMDEEYLKRGWRVIGYDIDAARKKEAADAGVALAADGAEGIARQEEEPADLIITDLIMPEKEGIILALTSSAAENRLPKPNMKVITKMAMIAIRLKRPTRTSCPQFV